MKSVVVGAILAVIVAIAGFYYGREKGSATCVKCLEVESVASLRSVLESTLKIILAEEIHSLKMDFSQQSQRFPGMARLLSRVGFKEFSQGTLYFDSKFVYGYDLKDVTGWSVKKDAAGKIAFEAPPVTLLTCPAVLTQTMKVTYQQTSIFVDEDARVLSLARLATADALSIAHKQLNDETTRSKIIKAADAELAALLVKVSSGVGLNLQMQDIKISRPRGDFSAPPDWTPGSDVRGLLNEQTKKAMQDAKCGLLSA